MAVITVSRQFGSGGDKIVEMVCEAAGYQIFDKSIIAAAARDAGLSDQAIVDYSESTYKVRNFFSRLFGGGRTLRREGGKGGERLDENSPLSEENALSLVRKAVIYAHGQGDMIIVGRGGQVLLRGCPDVLHVRVVAPMHDRLQRLRNDPILAGRVFTNSAEDRREERELIRSSDAASSGYLRQFYGVDWADPLLYHLVINTGFMPPNQAAGLIVDAARQLDRVTAGSR